MPLDSSIPLQYNSAMPDFVHQQAEAVSLRSMRDEQVQRQRMDPLIYQQAQQAATQQKIQTQILQQQQKDQGAFSDALKRAQSPGTASTQPTPSATENTDAPAAPIPNASASAAAPAPVPNAPANAPVPLSAMAATTGSDSPPAAIPTAPPAVSQQQSIAAASQQATAARSATHPIDLMKVADDAFNSGGMSYAGYQAATAKILAHRKELAATSLEENKVNDEREDRYLGALAAFRQHPQDYQQKNWAAFNQQAFNDGNLTADHYALVLKQHPDLPDVPTLDSYQLAMQSASGQRKAVLQAQEIATSKAAQTAHNATQKKAEAELPEQQSKAAQEVRSNNASQLGAAQTYGDYNKARGSLPGNQAAAFPDFLDQDPSAPITADHRKAIRQPGVTPAQQSTEEIAGARVAEQHTRDIEAAKNAGIMQGLAQQRINQRQDQIDQSAAARNAAVTPLKSKLLTDVDAMQRGKGLPTTGNDLKAAIDAGYGVGDPEIEPYRADLRDWADKTGKNEATVQHTQAGTEKLKTGGKGVVLAFGPDGKTVMKTGVQLPATSVNQPKPAQPTGQTRGPAQAAPAVRTGAPKTKFTETPENKTKYTEEYIRQKAVTRGFKADGPEANAAVKQARANGELF